MGLTEKEKTISIHKGREVGMNDRAREQQGSQGLRIDFGKRGGGVSCEDHSDRAARPEKATD